MSEVSARSHPLALRHLRYVLVVTEQESIRLAAAELALSVDVLVRELSRVECAFGTPLFEPRRSRVHATKAGREVAEMARRTLDTRAVAVRDSCPSIPVLRVGYMDYPPGQAIQRAALAEFRAQHPHIPLELTPVPFTLQAEAVTRGTIALGFHFGPLQPLDGIRAELLMPEVVSCVLLPSGHRLAARRELSMSDLVGTPLRTMRTDDSPEVMAAVHDAIARGGWHGRHTNGSSSPSEVMGMVASGAGWSPAPSALIAWAPPSLAVRPLADAPLTGFDMHVLWREGDPDAAALAHLMLELRPVVAGPPHSGGPSRASGRWHEETSRVVQQLHHEMLQDIVGSQMSLQALGGQLPLNENTARAIVDDAAEGLTRIGRVARQAMRTIQAPTDSAKDIALSLVNAAAELSASSGAAFHFRTVGVPLTLAPARGALAHRVAVSALQSAYRRSSVQNVFVSLEYLEHSFRLSITDDARRDADELQGADHPNDVPVLRPHEAATGAVLIVRHDPATGSTLELRIPLDGASSVAASWD